MVSLGGYSPFNDYVSILGAEGENYQNIQQNLSLYGALQSGVVGTSDPNAISNLTVDTFRLSQEAQNLQLQKTLAENAIKQEQRDLNNIIFNLFADN